MAFTSFTSVDQLLERYGLIQRREAFVRPVPGVTLSPSVQENLAFILTEFPFERTEVATRESVIFPILNDVWRHYRAHLAMFSGEPLVADDDLRGELDYMVCRRSRHGPFTPDQPVLLVGEAKREDATVGWNQALGGMIAAQRIDAHPGRVYYGLATTGRNWAFGRLSGADFTLDPNTLTTSQLDVLAGALHFVFAACRDQVLSQPPAAA